MRGVLALAALAGIGALAWSKMSKAESSSDLPAGSVPLGTSGSPTVAQISLPSTQGDIPVTSYAYPADSAGEQVVVILSVQSGEWISFVAQPNGARVLFKKSGQNSATDFMMSSLAVTPV